MHRRTLTLLPLVSLATFVGAASSSGAVVAVEVSVPRHPAEWVEEEVARPFERSLSRLPGLVSMKSASSESRYLLELRYEGTPAAQAVAEARSVALATWSALSVSVPEPTVGVREAELG